LFADVRVHPPLFTKQLNKQQKSISLGYVGDRECSVEAGQFDGIYGGMSLIPPPVWTERYRHEINRYTHPQCQAESTGIYDRYRVTIFDPKGKQILSTGTHLERQGALAEASRYVDHLLTQQRTTEK
jgi:hypothetical protein